MDDTRDAQAKGEATLPLVRKAGAPGRWEAVPLMQYKQEGSAPFRDISRQVLFDDAGLAAQVRYFEMQPDGHSTLERHRHMHAVMILRGRGRCLVGNQVFDVAEGDLVRIPALHWHQFRATAGEPLGFLCVVNSERDRPQLPDAQALATLRADPRIAEFIRG